MKTRRRSRRRHDSKRTPSMTELCAFFFRRIPYPARFFLLGLLAAGLAGAPALHADITRPFSSLKKKLIADGFDPRTVERLYGDPRVRADVTTVRLFFRHREAKLDYGRFTTPRAIRKASAYLKTHEKTLNAVEKRYGVDKTVITAILLVETHLGTSVGRRSTLNTLSTLAALADADIRDAFHKAVSKQVPIDRKAFEAWARKKSRWAYKELTAFIQYTLRENLDPASITGSYAGALGIAQFMPTSILAYAQDGNRDGRIDLFHHADAAASIAGYLKRFGWRPGIDRKKAAKVIFMYNRSTYYVDTILKIRDLLKG